MGASREGATGVPGERTWLAGLGDRSRPSTLRAALRRANHHHSPRAPVRRTRTNLDHHAMFQRRSEVHQPLHREPLQLLPLQRRDPRLIHAQHSRRLRLRQLARRQNRVQRGRQPHLRSQLYCVGQPTLGYAANIFRQPGKDHGAIFFSMRFRDLFR